MTKVSTHTASLEEIAAFKTSTKIAHASEASLDKARLRSGSSELHKLMPYESVVLRAAADAPTPDDRHDLERALDEIRKARANPKDFAKGF